MTEPIPPKTNGRWLVRQRGLLLVAGPLVVAVVAVVLYLMGGRYVSTDDAYVQAARTEISATVAGRVTQVFMRDNQRVKKGDVLFTLDARANLIAINQARAQLANARLQIEADKTTVRQRQADRRVLQETLALRQTELTRQKTLAAAGIASQAQLDQAVYAVATARQQLAAGEQEIDRALVELGGDIESDVNTRPSVHLAQAALDQAELNLTYTRVIAPSDGIIAKAEQLQVGDYINAATPLFWLISATDMWVEANFKESDLTYMRPGQAATIRIDTYSGTTLTGKVASLSPGTGSAFALLPPENATGNWVKVVQRLPVRITLDATASPSTSADLPLAAGMSAVVEIDTGHRRTLFAPDAKSPDAGATGAVKSN